MIQVAIYEKITINYHDHCVNKIIVFMMIGMNVIEAKDKFLNLILFL